MLKSHLNFSVSKEANCINYFLYLLSIFPCLNHGKEGRTGAHQLAFVSRSKNATASIPEPVAGEVWMFSHCLHRFSVYSGFPYNSKKTKCVQQARDYGGNLQLCYNLRQCISPSKVNVDCVLPR